MKNSICIHPSRIFALFLLMFSSACQPAPSPASPTPYPTSLPVKSTATDTILISLPTPTASLTAIAQPVIQPAASKAAIPLSTSGPWLVYKPRYTSENEHFILNQDGTGRVEVTPDCNASNIQESPSNRLVTLPGMVYLFEPSQARWTLVYSDWPNCGSDFTGNTEKGLLASFYHATEDAIPELRIHELPSGTLRDQLSLYMCSDQSEPCDTGYIESWMLEMKWSPNGRYLAFSAVLDGQSDLYMYDTQTGNILRLTSGPDSVAQISWSPDGKWIIMGELHESSYPYTTSLWAVSAADNEMRKLYSLETAYPQGILGWLDDRRFIVYGGTSLHDALDLPAYGFHLVDIDASKVTDLFEGIFAAVELDREHETLAIYAFDPEPREGYEGQGIYLVSTANPKIRYVGPGQLRPDWNDELKLFVTEEPCEDDPKGQLAFDYKGEWQCIGPSFPDRYPSPDGQWQVSVGEGTWLEKKGGQSVQLGQGNAVQAIWRLDSEGFFFVADQILYYVSLPQVIPVMVDGNVNGGTISYQWLDGD